MLLFVMRTLLAVSSFILSAFFYLDELASGSLFNERTIKNVSHQYHCELECKVKSITKKTGVFSIEFEVLGPIGKNDDSVACQSFQGSMVLLEFDSKMDLKKGERVRANVFVSGGKTAEGIVETQTWSIGSKLALPIRTNTPKPI
jgi:hypothetical protein